MLMKCGKALALARVFLVIRMKSEKLRAKDALVTMCPCAVAVQARPAHGGTRVRKKAFHCRIRLPKIHRMRRRWRPRVDLRRCPGY